MPKRCTLSPDDYRNPDAPVDERRLRADHILVRDLSYDRCRMRQLLDLYKASLFDPGWTPGSVDPNDESTWQTERLEVYLKERPRGEGYVADFVYRAKDLPVVVYGVLVNRGRGLEVAELELFRPHWGYDFEDQYTGPDDADIQSSPDTEEAPTLITSDLLRRIPLGTIVAQAQQVLAKVDWRAEGITVFMGPDRSADQLTPDERAAMENAVTAAGATKRGRPELPDDLLADVAQAYLQEAAVGAGLTRRLSERFDRPEATVRDWIAATRRRGYLSDAVPGRRGATPGPRLAGTRPDHPPTS